MTLLDETADRQGNVLEFRRREPGDEEALELLRRAPPPACKHLRRRLIDEKQRTVTCGECGASLDPIWCLLTLIEYRQQLKREREWIEAEKRRLEARRQRAIARRQRAAARAQLRDAAASCQACEGIGWRRVRDGQGVERATRCECRKPGGAARLV